MALVKCPDCGKMISDSSPACIGCGRPQRIRPGSPAASIAGESGQEVTASALPIEKPGSMDNAFYDQLFEAKRSWDGGNHSNDNFWANWKYEQAKKVENPHCGTFEWWDSIAPPHSVLSQIERKVEWALIVLWGANLKPNYTVVNDYFKSDGTHVSSHLRKI